MKIKITAKGLWDKENMKPLKEGDVIDLSEKRAKKAIKNKLAKEIKEPKKD
jgi:hypothetical protein